MAISRVLVLVLALAALSGCYSGRAYEGTARPGESVSVIYGRSPLFGNAMLVRQVDQQPPFLPMLNKVEVLPGKHTIQIAYISKTPLPPYTMLVRPVIATLETAPGHKYQIDGEGHLSETNNPRVWIMDTTTGEKVWELVP